MSGNKRRTLTIGEKIAIISSIEQGASNSSISKRLNLSTSTISTIWKKKDIIINAFEKNKCNMKKLRATEKNDLEEALFNWFKKQIKDNITISIKMFKQKAECFASELGYTLTKGWLSRFRRRNGIMYDRVKREVIVKPLVPENMSMTDEVEDDESVTEEPSDESISESVNVEIIKGTQEIEIEFIELSHNGIIEATAALETLTSFYETNTIDPEFLKHLQGLKDIMQNIT